MSKKRSKEKLKNIAYLVTRNNTKQEIVNVVFPNGLTVGLDDAGFANGLKVNGNTTVVDLMVNNDTFRGVVSGVIHGARTVRINPTGEDTYEIVLEIDHSTISQLMQSATQSS